VNERSWGAWLAHIDSDFWIGRCIGIDMPTLEIGVKSFGRFLQLELFGQLLKSCRQARMQHEMIRWMGLVKQIGLDK